jgi:hypothetical protein
LSVQAGPTPTPQAERELDTLDARIQEYRNDLSRLFLLIKRVTGIQKSGTGGTDFLDPLKHD